ncbi:hypothetical protein SAMN02745866_00424 [Alteromonadaceae bacterium Bs31]|nr:hypothetical protein SAMN02745866_00424 [Alteromonadaceae bacterium Bs31]
MSRKTNQQFVEGITQQLDKSTELDEHSLDSLAAARQRALAAIPQKPSKNYYWIGGAITTSLLAALLWLTPSTTERAPKLDLAELEWLLESDDLQMLEDELPFYDWVEMEVEAG